VDNLSTVFALPRLRWNQWVIIIDFAADSSQQEFENSHFKHTHP